MLHCKCSLHCKFIYFCVQLNCFSTKTVVMHDSYFLNIKKFLFVFILLACGGQNEKIIDGLTEFEEGNLRFTESFLLVSFDY